MADKPPRKRRVQRPAPEGTDPKPSPEPKRLSGTENDDRLKQDKPPHY